MESSLFNRIKNSNLGQAWLVLLLTIFFGGSLAGVQATLGPRITQNKINETLEKVPELILGKELARKFQADGLKLDVEEIRVSVKTETGVKVFPVYEAKEGDILKGWVVKTSGRGYADNIEILLGLDGKMEAITGLYILDQKETPGLGNKIIDEGWRGQYIGKSASEPIFVVKTGAKGKNEINAISGATISSNSVTGIINGAVKKLGPALKSRESKKIEQ